MAPFESTNWSVVLASARMDDPSAAKALAKLCETYWYPLYVFVRSQGKNEDDARDLTQAYFTELLEKNILKSVHPSKGKFRSFLLVTLRNFIHSERAKATAKKRSPGKELLSLDAAEAEERYRLEPVDRLTPEELFQRRWALLLVQRTLEALEQECRDQGKLSQFESLRGYLTGNEERPYHQTAPDLGMNEGAMKTAVHRLRKRWGDLLRAEIRQTVTEEREVDQELRELLRLARDDRRGVS